MDSNGILEAQYENRQERREVSLTEKQSETIAGLREMADFLEQNPELIDMIGTQTFYMFHYTADVKDFARKALMLGNFEKSSDSVFFNVDRYFGPVRLQLTARHELICEKVVIDSQEVETEELDPELVRIALADIPKVKVVTTVERTAWKCPPSLVEAAQ